VAISRHTRYYFVVVLIEGGYAVLGLHKAGLAAE
jgi:hypothetical protein